MDGHRVLIADDHDEFRRGLEALLAATPDVEVVGTASDGAMAIALALDLQPDVVLMDLHMPRVNGIDATAQIVGSSPHIGVLVLTMKEDEESVFAAMRAGARGYLLKGARRGEITRAVQAVGAGEVGARDALGGGVVGAGVDFAGVERFAGVLGGGEGGGVDAVGGLSAVGLGAVGEGGVGVGFGDDGVVPAGHGCFVVVG